MIKRIIMLVLAGVSFSAVCYAGSADYHIKQLTFDNLNHVSLSGNSSGDVVWTQTVNGFVQVFSLDGGQLTFDEWDHTGPDINSQGELVCIKRTKNELPSVYSSLRGEIAKGDVSNPRVNDDGEVIWKEKRGLGYIFVSSIKGETVLRPSQSADITDSGEIIYLGNTSSGRLELFSTKRGQISSGVSCGTPRVNNQGEIVWEKEINVGDKTFRQIFSNTNGNVTQFQEGDSIMLGSVDDKGVIYYSKLKDGYFQIFAAVPDGIYVDDAVQLAQVVTEKAETYKTPDEELFRKIDEMESFGGDSGPALMISEPHDDSLVNGLVQVSIFSYDESELSHCYLQVDDKYLGWDEEPPFQFAWNSQYWNDGEHVITIVGHFENTENPTQVASVIITSQNDKVIKPSLSIVSPRNGETVNGVMAVSTDATSDNFSYVYSEIDVGFKDWDNTPPYAFNVDTKAMSNGSHMIKVYGWHKQGGESVEDVVHVIVSN